MNDVSVNYNIARTLRGNETFEEMLDSNLKMYSEAGFKYIDADLSYMTPGWDKNSPIGNENWENSAYKFKECAIKNGISFYQVHGAMFDYFAIKEPDISDELTKKSVKIAGILGTKYIVFHPHYFREFTADENIRKTLYDFERLLKWTGNEGIGLLIENMPNWGNHFNRTEDIIEIVDYFNTENFGICWDTSHASMEYKNEQDKEILKAGNRIKAVHMSDNLFRTQPPHAFTDDHMMPFEGYIDWKKVKNALVKAGYNGTYNLELLNYSAMPSEAQKLSIKLAYAVADYIANNLI